MDLIGNVILRRLPSGVRVIRGEGGFQTAEAIGISAVGLLVLFAIWGALSVLGVDLIDWIRASFGIGSGSPLPPPAS